MAKPELQLFRSLWGLERYMIKPNELFRRIKAEGYVGVEASLQDLGKIQVVYMILSSVLSEPSSNHFIAMNCVMFVIVIILQAGEGMIGYKWPR